jgi:hypothetical protein
MILNFLVYAAIGRVCIFFLQRFPFERLPKIGGWWLRGGSLHDLWFCSLCLGVWVYTPLAYLMQIDLMGGWFPHIPGITELLTGAVTSLLAFLIQVGWQTEFGEITITAE